MSEMTEQAKRARREYSRRYAQTHQRQIAETAIRYWKKVLATLDRDEMRESGGKANAEE